MSIFKNPRWDNAYIQQLAFIEQNPGTTKRKVLFSLYGRSKNFDVFGNLIINSAIKVVGYGKFDAPLFEITPYGKSLLNRARKTKFVFDLIDFVLKSNIKTLDELEINSSLEGKHEIVEPPFVKKVIEAIKKDPLLLKKLKTNIPFINEYLKIADQLCIDEHSKLLLINSII